MTDTDKQLLDSILAIVAELENPDTDMSAWIDSQLSIETIHFSPSGDWRGAEVLCAFGGPGIRVESQEQMVYGAWGTTSYERKFNDDYRLDDELEAMYEHMIRRN